MRVRTNKSVGRLSIAFGDHLDWDTWWLFKAVVARRRTTIAEEITRIIKQEIANSYLGEGPDTEETNAHT